LLVKLCRVPTAVEVPNMLQFEMKHVRFGDGNQLRYCTTNSKKL